jgi:hypothetical protein
MKNRSMPLARRPLSWTLALALTLVALEGRPAAAQTPAESVERLLHSPRFDRAATERLYAEAVLRDGVPALDRALDAAAAPSQTRSVQTLALLAKAVLSWQRGDIDAAQASADRAALLSPGAETWLLQAQLLDARGDTQAAAAYARAAQATTDPAERARLRLRNALLTGRNGPALLVQLGGSDPAHRDRIAIIAALLGDTRDALSLYHPAESGTTVLVDALRLAEWAIASGDGNAARDQAWRAYRAAATVPDRRYALALLVESYRNRSDLAGALAFLEPHAADAEIAQTRIDLLLELGRYDAALAAVSTSNDPAMRQRLLAILDLAGRAREGEAEYRRLIAADPHRLEGYSALAVLALSKGQRDAAVAAYRALFAANPGRADLLVPAARQMIAMGLSDAAMALMQAAATAPGMAAPYRFFLVETARGQGKDAAALEQLATLRRQLSPSAPERIAVADAYEALGHKEDALAVLREVEAHTPALDYDQRVRIAALAGDSGHAQEALARWRRLWSSANLPARKTYLAKQIVRTAQQLGETDKLIAELEAGLADRRIGEDKLALLVELRIAKKDRLAAISDVERQAKAGGESETARLKRQVGVYARLQDHARVGATLRQLVAADPKNADLYLRQLTLNAVRFAPDGEAPPAQFARIEALLAEVRKASALDPLQASRFAAAVYASAGYTDRAIDAYRHTAAMAPGDVEAIVQLADLLRKQGQQPQAAALLQYAADHARDANTFVAAIDALMAALSPEPNGPPPPPGLARLAANRLRWAERRILERIVTEGEDARFYALLADLAQAEADFALQLRAYTNALPIAGDQRPAVLRMLVTLASGGAASGDDGNGPTVGDVSAKLAFGRRLLTLKRDYPPDVYTDLARALLAVGDVPGAERAFGMMREMDGLVDIDRVKGETYAAQGLVDPALLNYERALLRDRDDPDLVVKTSILREQRGDDPAAFDWYWRTFTALVLRQPLRGGGSEDAALDARQYYATLVEGLLLTWPADEAASARVRAGFAQLFDGAAAAVAPGPGQTLQGYARLALLTQFGRRIADHLGDPALAEQIEQRLAPLLADDPAARHAAAAFRDIEGWVAAPPAGADWVEHGLARQAQDNDNGELAQSVALASGDPAAIRGQLALAMAAEAENDAGMLAGHPRPGMASPLYTLLIKAVDALPADQFRTLLLTPIEAAPYRSRVLFDIYRSGGGWYGRIEKAAGHPLFNDGQLLELLFDHGNGPLPFARATFATRRDKSASPAGLIERFPVGEKLDLYERLVERMRAQGAETAYQEALVGQLLVAPLDNAQQARLGTAIETDIGFDRGLKNRAAAFVVQKLLVLDPDPANRPLLLRLTRTAAARYADARHLPLFLQALFAGDDATAYRELKALYADTSAHYQGMDYAAPIIRDRFAAERRREIDAFLALDHADKPVAAAFYRDFVIANQSSSIASERAELPRYYLKLAALEPDNPSYVSGALDALWTKNDRAGFIAMLTRYLGTHADDREAASVLQLACVIAGDPAQAAALTRSSGADIRNEDWLVEMVNRAHAQRDGRFEPDFRFLFGRLYGAYAAIAAHDPAVIEAERRRMLAERQQATPSATSPLLDVVRALPQGPAAVRAVLRARWRATTPHESASGASSPDRQQLLQALPDADAPSGGETALRDTLETPLLTRELERWLDGVDPALRPYQARLDALIVAGLVKQGKAGERVQAGLAALSAGTIRPAALHQLALLMQRTGVKMRPEGIGALTRRLATLPGLTVDERIRYAGLLGDAGDSGTAARLLDAAILQMLYPSQIESVYASDAEPQLAAIVAALRNWQDRTVARATYAALRERIRRELGTSADEAPFGNFPAFDAAK